VISIARLSRPATPVEMVKGSIADIAIFTTRRRGDSFCWQSTFDLVDKRVVDEVWRISRGEMVRSTRLLPRTLRGICLKSLFGHNMTNHHVVQGCDRGLQPRSGVHIQAWYVDRQNIRGATPFCYQVPSLPSPLLIPFPLAIIPFR
jgi:hypothetical protein